MNFLAHAFLSFDEPETLTGNLISDFVKGKRKFDYAPGIQRGISLHRSIDNFTDTHPATTAAKSFFREYYGLYAGAFVDVVYDHFLAIDHTIFPDEQNLYDFSVRTYQELEPYVPVCPRQFQLIFHYMKEQNWLYNYRLPEGIKNSFTGLTRRAKYMDDSRPAFRVFNEHYAALRNYYELFFPEMKNFALKEFSRLRSLQ